VQAGIQRLSQENQLPGCLAAFSQNLVAGIAHLASGCFVQVHELGGSVGGVTAMAGDAAGGIRIDRLPTWQERMEMVVEAAIREHVLMTLEAALVADGPGEFCRLDGRMRIIGQGIMRAEQLGLHAPEDPYAGMTVDAARVFWCVGRSQVHRLGVYRTLIES
jgi:hypothetical protein